MSVPSVKLTVEDGALGLVSFVGAQDVVLFGTCTLGTPGVPFSLRSSEQARELAGHGPLAAAAGYVADRGGATVWCVPVQQSSPGSMAAWNTPGGPAVGNTGTPVDAYQVRVKITAGGALGVSKFQYSLDGGTTYEPEASTVATYPLPNTGITLTFAAGTYVLNEIYASDATPPAYTSVELATAIDAWRASGQTAKIAADVGVPANAAAGATLAGVFAAKADTAEAAGDYFAVLQQAPPDTLAALTTAYAAVASKRQGIAATFVKLADADGRSLRRPFLWVVLGEAARRPISEDLGRVLTGAIPNVQSIEHDEEATPGYAAAKFIVPRTLRGRAGFYINNPVLRSPTGSDFDLLQMRRVMDVACDVVRGGLTDYLNDTIETQPPDPSNPAAVGTIDPIRAAAIENTVQAKLTAAVIAEGHASSSAVLVNRTDKIVTTRKLRVKVRIGSLAWAKQIETSIGFAAPSVA